MICKACKLSNSRILIPICADNSTIGGIVMNNLDLELAIREDDLAALSFEVEDYVDRISVIFEKYNNIISKLPSCYKSDSVKMIMNYYNEVKKSFPVVKGNIKGYASDYRDLIKIINSTDKKFAGIIDSYAD